MALIGCGTDDRIATDADTRLTGVRLGAGVFVVTCGSVGLVWIRTCPRAGVAHPGGVALIERGADNGRSSCAGSALACLTCDTCVAVIARGAICLRRI